jgi:hypothetical protein
VTVVAWGVAGLLALAAGFLPTLLPGRRAVVAPAAAAGGTGAPGGADGGPSTGWRLPSEAPPPPPWWTGGSLGAASVGAMRQPLRLGSIEAATVLALVDLLFAGFVVLQAAYLFGGRDTMAVAGLTYAEYARRGFFELVAVAMLAGMLVVVLDLAVAWRGRAQLAASLVLLGLTAVVLLSAFLRLRLYQDMYGWTELRFVVLTAILWLAVALAATVWLLLARMSRWTLHVLGVLSLVTVAVMNLVGPQAFVADRNLERALNPGIVPVGGRTGLDASYLAQLGDEAIAPVVAAYPGLSPQSRLDVARFLAERSMALSADPSYQGWASWNLTRERAREALRDWTPAGR